MKIISILNDVLGPVMRGPSSSHTAGPYHIALLASSLLGEPAVRASFTFDPLGSFAEVYRQQCSDLGFASGILGLDITDQAFLQSLQLADAQGVEIRFITAPLPLASHPNTVEVNLTGASGAHLTLTANSIGGGAVRVHHLEGWPVSIDGSAWDVVLVVAAEQVQTAEMLLASYGQLTGDIQQHEVGSTVCLQAARTAPLSIEQRSDLRRAVNPQHMWESKPIFFIKSGSPLFASAQALLEFTAQNELTLGQAALEYEVHLLGLGEQTVKNEVLKRFRIMQSGVEEGLSGRAQPALLAATAHNIFQAEADKRLVIGGPNTRAAARAMAVMHVGASSGVICAAPTGGSAGVIPAVMTTLLELLHAGDDLIIEDDQIILALLAASAVGLVLASRASFAAEEYGCNVEIGAACAMGAAAVVEAAGGTPSQAFDAAAICFQNSMGATCDPVQGIAEMPCFTRNAAAASDAFLAADLVLGGYGNPIPLDETIDAVAQVGRIMPRELRCTALGGLSLAPSGLRLPRRTNS